MTWPPAPAPAGRRSWKIVYMIRISLQLCLFHLFNSEAMKGKSTPHALQRMARLERSASGSSSGLDSRMMSHMASSATDQK